MVNVDNNLRLRYLLKEWYIYILLVLVIFTVITTGWAYEINLNPEVESQQELVGLWSESTNFQHSVNIENDSIPFQKDMRVENRPIYYTSLSKKMDGEYTYNYTASSGSVDVTTETYLEMRSVRRQDGEVVETYWNVVEPLDSTSQEDLKPNEDHTVDFVIEIPFILETVEEVQNQLNSTKGLTDVRVVSVSNIEGTVRGDSVDKKYTSEMALNVDSTTYQVSEKSTINEEHRIEEKREVISEPPLLKSIGSIIISALGIVSVIALILGRKLDYIVLTEEEEEKINIYRSREQFSEWITTGEFPSEREYEQTVLVDDLEGLVDVAIDTNKRVIEDKQLEVSTVLDDNYVYIYIHPDSPAKDWLTGFADETIDDTENYDF